MVCNFITSDGPGPLLVVMRPDITYILILRIKNKYRNVNRRQGCLCPKTIPLSAFICPYHFKVNRAEPARHPASNSFLMYPSLTQDWSFFTQRHPAFFWDFDLLLLFKWKEQLLIAFCTSWLMDVIFWLKLSLLWLSIIAF